MLKICEIFESLSGETTTSGLPALFLRCSHCNLNCGYCDTPYKNDGREYSDEELFDILMKDKNDLIIITGGEPLLKDNRPTLHYLVSCFPYKSFIFETNGSQEIYEFLAYKNVQFVVDYKLPCSGMEKNMDLDVWDVLESSDIIKFVIETKEDYKRAIKLVKKHKPCAKIYFGPVFGKINLKELWEWIVRDKIGQLQLQLHKIVFGNKRGV